MSPTLTQADQIVAARRWAEPIPVLDLELPEGPILRMASRHMPPQRRSENYRSVVRTDGPLGYWRLGEALGSAVAADEMGAFPGAYSGSPTLGAVGLVPSDVDTAMTVTSPSNFMSVAHQAALVPAVVTVEAWANITSFANLRSIVRKAAPVGASYALFVNAGGTPSFSVRVSGGVAVVATGAAALSINTTYHLVGTYDGTQSRLYVNGSLVATTAGAGTIDSDPQPIILGVSAGISMVGTVDDVAIYPRALTAAEIVAHFLTRPREITLTPERLGLIASWGTLQEASDDFDAGSSPSTLDGLQIVNAVPVAGRARFSDLILTPGNPTGYEFAGAKATLSVYTSPLATVPVLLDVFYIEDVVDITEQRCTLRMSDLSLLLEDAMLLPRISREILPHAPRASFDKVIPVPFGPNRRIPAVPIVDGAASTLASAIDIVQTTIDLDDNEISDDFPDSGSGLIEHEMFTWTARSGRTLTGVTRGAYSTQAVEHGEGTSVFEALTSYVFGVAVGPIPVADIRVSGVSAKTSPVASLDTSLIPGTPITIITFPVTDMQAFHVIGAGGTLNLSPAEVKVEDPASSGTRTISPGFAFSAPNHRTVNFSIPFSGGSPSWNVKRRLAGGVYTTIASGGPGNLPFTGSHTADYLSDGDDQIQLNIVAGSGYDVHLQFTSYTIVIDSTGTTPSGGSTSVAVLGEVTCDVVGVKDDDYGTISGIPRLVLENPVDIAKWTHLNLYRGVTLAMFDESWAVTRGLLAGAGIRWAFLLGFDGPVLHSDLRRQIGEQSRSELAINAGLLSMTYVPDAPVAEATLDYFDDVWEGQPAPVSRSDRTQIFTRVIGKALRNYLDSGNYRYSVSRTDPAAKHITELIVEMPFVAERAVADALTAFRLSQVRRQRWQTEPGAWTNILALERGQHFAIANHPILEAHGSVVFRLKKKAYLMGDENPARIRVWGLEGNNP